MADPKLTLMELDESSRQEWDQWVRNSPQGTVFQSWSYLSTVSCVFHRPVKVLVARSPEQMEAGMVIYPRSRAGLHWVTTPFYIPYNGIMLREAPPDLSYPARVKREQAVIGLFSRYLRERYAFSELYLKENLKDLRHLIWDGWELRPTYTIRIPLAREANLLETLPHNQRRHINKFRNINPDFRESTRVDQLYNLWFQSYQYHRMFPPISQKQFSEFCTELLQQKLAHCYAVEIEHREVAMMLVVEDPPHAYALFSGKDFGKGNSEAELYLHWRLMKLFQEREFTDFDLLGAMAPTIARVKLELGGRLLRADHARYFRNQLVRVLFRISATLRQRHRSG